MFIRHYRCCVLKAGSHLCNKHNTSDISTSISTRISFFLLLMLVLMSLVSCLSHKCEPGWRDCGWVSIDALDWHLDQNFINIPMNTRLTLLSYTPSKVGQLSAKCWPTHDWLKISWLSTDFQLRCRWSVNGRVNRGPIKGIDWGYCEIPDYGCLTVKSSEADTPQDYIIWLFEYWTH